MKFLSPVLLLAAAAANATTLPGFRVETVASVSGFVTSVAADSRGILYLTTTDGWVHRVEDGTAVRVASLPTHSGGNGGLLGLALLDDSTAVVHYTTWDGERVLDDVISLVDLTSGAETVLKAFPCDIEHRARGVSAEHHGGNPAVAPDGSIFVGIGDFGGRSLAQKPEWHGGKIHRLTRDGTSTQFALGMRNPFDQAWDPDLKRLVVSDNGPQGGDEIHIIDTGANCGWPDTYGNEQQSVSSVAPDYVFPDTVAPTGLARLDGSNPLLRRGYLLGAFVTNAVYYFPDLAARPVADPTAIIDDFGEFVIDVIQSADGQIHFATATFAGSSSIHRLIAPMPGDCNGDGLLNTIDYFALLLELADGPSQAMVDAQNGQHRGSWGCDVTADGRIDVQDRQKLVSVLMKKRAVRPR